MNNIFKKILVLLSVLVFSQSLVANEEKDLETLFVKKLDEVILVVKNKSLLSETRNDKIITLLTPMFDFNLMAKLSLGKKAWKKLSKEDRVKFVELYVERMKKSYASKIDSYENEKVEILKTIKKKNRISIFTNIKASEKNVDVIYKYYKPKKPKVDKDTWLIYDVEVLGISILKADKAQFKEFLRTKSINELMNVLAGTTPTALDAK